MSSESAACIPAVVKLTFITVESKPIVMEAVSGDQFMRSGGYGRRASRRGRKVERVKGANPSAREFRSLSLDKRILLSENKKPAGDVLPSGMGPDAFLIARLNDSSSYFFTWFCKRYRIRIGDQDVGGKLEILRCPICLDMCTKSIELQCGHAFCRPCLTTAAANNMTSCALCRREQVINPELLRAQFDEQRMLNLAQRLAIPPPLRPRPPTSAASVSEGAGQKLEVSVEVLTKSDVKDVLADEEAVTPSSPHAGSMTAHGHLLFGPWGDVGAMTPKELRRRWKVSNLRTSTLPVTFAADVGAASLKTLASSWRELQRMSRASSITSAVEHGLETRAPLSFHQTPKAEDGLGRYALPGHATSPRDVSHSARGNGPPGYAIASDGDDPSVGNAPPGDLRARWRALTRVPPGSGFRSSSTLVSGLSANSFSDYEPLSASYLKTKHALPVVSARCMDEVRVEFVSSDSDIMTCQETVGSLTSVDLRQRWNAAFQGVEGDVGAMTVEELAVHLGIANGPQGVGGLSSAQLAERWLSCSIEVLDDPREERGTRPEEHGVRDGIIVAGNEGDPVQEVVRIETTAVVGCEKSMREPCASAGSKPLSPTSSQDVGAAPIGTVYTRWCAAATPTPFSVRKCP